jgi:hypothetical protein
MRLCLWRLKCEVNGGVFRLSAAVSAAAEAISEKPSLLKADTVAIRYY